MTENKQIRTKLGVAKLYDTRELEKIVKSKGLLWRKF